MRHSRNKEQGSPAEDEKKSPNAQLKEAVIQLFIADTDEEQDRVIADYPILISPAAISYVNAIVKYFDSQVTVVEGLPEQWENRRKFLESKQPKKNLHETDAA